MDLPKTAGAPVFSSKTRWIWHAGSRGGYHDYNRFRQEFVGPKTGSARLLITADAYYQVWLNGQVVGHGPAKSAAGRRSVDAYDVTAFLRPGANVLEVLVLGLGVGTMTHCLGEAGLIFELKSEGEPVVWSGGRTRVRPEAMRRRPTVRRWILPGVEDVDAAAAGVEDWSAATVVESGAQLYARRVSMPLREPVYPQRKVAVDRVELPGFQVGFRLKPALVSAEEAKRHEVFTTPAKVRLMLESPVAQVLRFTPTLGSVKWTFHGKELFPGGSGWRLWGAKEEQVEIRLKKGRNELAGTHGEDHFEHITLAGFVKKPLQVGALRVQKDGTAAGGVVEVEPLLFSNPQDLAMGALVSPSGEVCRTIWDLGAVYYGWIAFEAEGAPGSSLLLSFFEAMEGAKIQWPDGCNNALIYRLAEGRQQFESFFPYGVRYIAMHEIGGEVQVKNLRLLKASCSAVRQGFVQTGDALLDGIYKISAQSVESGTDDTQTDCPTFEQVNWNFDNRLASIADLLIYGNADITCNSIALFAEEPRRRGLVDSQTPTEWRGRPIPLWSFYWIMWCWDYYWATGDVDFVRSIFPAVAEGIDDALGRIGSRGLFEWPGAWHFVEWAHARDDDHAINTAEQAGLVAALDAAARLALAAGITWERTAARRGLVRAVNRHLWNPARGCYADSLHADGTQSPVSSRLTNAMVALHGIGGAAWSRRLALDLASEKRDGLLPFGSPLGLYPILELLDRHGQVEAIFRHVRNRWGDMVLAGDGTTWEMFAEYGHGGWPTRSRCHTFSAYVVKYFTKYLLGVEALKPGYSEVRIRPRPPKGIVSCHGAVPTPGGLLRVSWKTLGRRIVADVQHSEFTRIME
ncbi:MAG TPA: alpha-L-rhamnosidase C-terminal domain-containing protein [Rariglobus sp.]|nr:alpha-L-rhamnosidase C-terminal domain-containing protein [Rariglobus sp.]